MNKTQLKKCIGWRVSLRPQPISKDVALTDEWIVSSDGDIENGEVKLENIGTGYTVKLGTDHIHNFDSNPMRNTSILKHGFLTLHVQVIVDKNGMRVEPLPPSARGQVSKKRVDVTWPRYQME